MFTGLGQQEEQTDEKLLEKVDGVLHFKDSAEWSDEFKIPLNTLHALMLWNLMDVHTLGNITSSGSTPFTGHHVLWATFDGHREVESYDGTKIDVNTEDVCEKWMVEKWKEIQEKGDDFIELQMWERIKHVGTVHAAKSNL